MSQSNEQNRQIPFRRIRRRRNSRPSGCWCPSFSPTKQTEETVETPKIDQPRMEMASTVAKETTSTEAPYYYIDENGNTVWLTQEQIEK